MRKIFNGKKRRSNMMTATHRKRRGYLYDGEKPFSTTAINALEGTLSIDRHRVAEKDEVAKQASPTHLCVVRNTPSAMPTLRRQSTLPAM
jgi:hypothetical protein